MHSEDRVAFRSSNSGEDIFTPEFKELTSTLYDEFKERIKQVRRVRTEMLMISLDGNGTLPHPSSDDASGDWKVSPMPEELRKPGIEISGPASITSMFINALNFGPEGERAEGYLDDDEDSGGHSIEDTIQASRNRLNAVKGTVQFDNPQTGKHYELAPGDIPFFMHRERGLHLDEPDYTVDGSPIPASILGTAATLFHAGVAQAERGQGIYFYLPKMETPEEAAIYRDMFDSIRDKIPSLKEAIIRAIPLVESLPIVMCMEQSLKTLGEYAAGLNAARWDLKASLLEYSMTNPDAVWPDRFDVSVMGTPFIANIFRRLVAICRAHDAVPIGGMATALPSRDEAINTKAAEAITADKQWEAEQGFIRAWVAHIYHMKTAADPFKDKHASGVGNISSNADDFPIVVETPPGPITFEGTRQNARMLIEYIEGWLNGRGAKGIDRLAGRPGRRPALMEDLATARISVAQIAQRVLHGALCEDTGERHSRELAHRVLVSEVESIISSLGKSADASQVKRYKAAGKIAMKWTVNYLDMNFRSLGSYTRSKLLEIATSPDSLP